MKAGRLHHRVTVKVPETVSDGVGGQAVTWTNGPQIPADIQALSGREFLQAGALQNAMAARVQLRYRTDVQITSRLYREPDGPTYEVVGVRDLTGRRRWMELDVIEVDA